MIAVDLDKVLLAVCQGCNEEFSEEPCEPGCRRIRERLEKLPRVTLDDLRPKGRWVHKRSIYDSNIYICSNCKEQISILGNKLPSCPYCIADMRARTEE